MPKCPGMNDVTYTNQPTYRIKAEGEAFKLLTDTNAKNKAITDSAKAEADALVIKAKSESQSIELKADAEAKAVSRFTRTTVVYRMR